MILTSLTFGGFYTSRITIFISIQPHSSLFKDGFFFSSRFVLDRIILYYIGLPSVHLRPSPSPLIMHNKKKNKKKGYLKTNDSPNVWPLILWEMGKAFLRGAVISYASSLKNETIKKQVKLESKLAGLESRVKDPSDKHLYKEIRMTRSDIHQLYK